MEIGCILLKDETGDIVNGIAKIVRGNPFDGVRMVYEKWIQEDQDHSWKKLIQCFRDVQLNSLAKDIEQHFGLPSPSGRGTVVVLIVYKVLKIYC